MILQRLFATPPARAAGQGLYAAAARQSRNPVFYRDMGAPDTGEGRFEVYCLHVALLLIRLKGQGVPASEAAQGLFDAFVGSLDDALREMGVGDLSVPKRMKKLAQAIYGRTRSAEEALARLPDRTELESLLTRTVLQGPVADAAPALADYVVRAHQDLAVQPLEALLAGRAAWPEPVA